LKRKETNLLQAVIFDMDGLLVDSEPFWRRAEVEVFGSVGVPLTEDMCHQTTGMRMHAAVEHWYARYPWMSKSKAQVASEIIESVRQLLASDCQPMPGVATVLKKLKDAQLPLGLCSSSPLILIEAVLKRLGIQHQIDVIYSTEAEIHGKPHPGAYITTAKMLNVRPENTLVFEDSLTGAIAAKAASMKVIAVPEAGNFGNTKFDFCDMILPGLDDFDLDRAESLFR
jgi:HAD superfamily hydrolase (TIGR01509 family)